MAVGKGVFVGVTGIGVGGVEGVFVAVAVVFVADAGVFVAPEGVVVVVPVPETVIATQGESPKYCP